MDPQVNPGSSRGTQATKRGSTDRNVA